MLLAGQYRMYRESRSANFFDVDDQRCWEGFGSGPAASQAWDSLESEFCLCGVKGSDSTETFVVEKKLRALRGRGERDLGERLLSFRPAWEAFRLNGVYEDLYAVMRPDGSVEWAPQRGLSARRCRGALSRWLELSAPILFEEDPAPRWSPGGAPVQESCSVAEGLAAVAPPAACEENDEELVERKKRSASAVWGSLADDGVSLVGWDSPAQRKRVRLACLRSRRDRDTVYCWSQELGKGWCREDLEEGVHLLARKEL